VRARKAYSFVVVRDTTANCIARAMAIQHSAHGDVSSHEHRRKKAIQFLAADDGLNMLRDTRTTKGQLGVGRPSRGAVPGCSQREQSGEQRGGGRSRVPCDELKRTRGELTTATVCLTKARQISDSVLTLHSARVLNKQRSQQRTAGAVRPAQGTWSRDGSGNS